MIVPHRFAEGSRGVPFGTEDDAPLFEIVVGAIGDRRPAIADSRSDRRVIELVTEAERGRLPAAGGGPECRVRILIHRTRIRIVGILVAAVDFEMQRRARVLGLVDDAAHDRVSSEIGRRGREIALGARGNR